MGQQYLIDSNSVIDYLSGKLYKNGMSFMNQVINDIPIISVITQIEVLGYNFFMKSRDSLFFILVLDKLDNIRPQYLI